MRLRRQERKLILLLLKAALLGFEHEAPALVEIDAADRRGAVAILEMYRTLEHVGVLGRVGYGRLGTRHVKEIAELTRE